MLETVGAQLRLRSTSGSPTFEETTFTAPTVSLTINLGADDDTLTIASLGTFSGQLVIAGAAGNDTITVTDGALKAQIDGGDGTDTLIGPNAASLWDLTAADAGSLNGTASFSAIENLTGGTGEDRFKVETPDSINGQIDGGLGVDTLVGPDAANTWNLTGADIGTLNTPTHVVAGENLTGGNADDAFKVQASGSVSGALDGGSFDATAPTINSLDFSERGSVNA